jgi:hypothetical protein
MEHELAALRINQSAGHGLLDSCTRLANGLRLEERRDGNLGEKWHGRESTPDGLALGVGDVVEVAEAFAEQGDGVALAAVGKAGGAGGLWLCRFHGLMDWYRVAGYPPPVGGIAKSIKQTF